MKNNVSILIIRSVGRCLILIKDAGDATDQIIKWAKKEFDEINTTKNTIYFSVNMHEDAYSIAQNILSIADKNN